MGTSDGSGAFRIERDGFIAPGDCTVDVNDGSATATTARLAGFTLRVTDQGGQQATQQFSITISP